MDKLGQRLAASEYAAEEDLQQLASVLGVYAEVLEMTVPRLTAVAEACQDAYGMSLDPVVSRVKTTDTIIDKQRRSPEMGLKGMQDIAGARIVGDIDRREQDLLAGQVEAEFAAEIRPPKITDRRVQPSSGYRAVHVIVFPAGIPVEVQIRTMGQQLWANLYERLADHWGRQIRYGGEPDSPDESVDGHLTRRRLVMSLQGMAEGLGETEALKVDLDDVERRVRIAEADPEASRDPSLPWARAQLIDLRQRYDAQHQRLMDDIQWLTEWATRMGY